MIERLRPMLAVASEPFDSDEHEFELKWDGIRALACVETAGFRLWGREEADYRPRYPELEFLAGLPSGTLLDGELVILQEGRADLPAMLRRHGLTGPEKIRRGARLCPVTYVVFDLPYLRGASLCSRPLRERRRMLAELLERHRHPQLCFSAGVAESGRDFFAAAAAQGHEGVMAKHLASRYLPGKRSAAWRKIKPVGMLPCVIIGYRPAGNGFSSLLVAAQQQGSLKYAGQLTSGFTERVKAELAPLLTRRRIRSQPLVHCPLKGIWIEADLYCLVRFLQGTASGRLRGASFAGLLSNDQG